MRVTGSALTRLRGPLVLLALLCAAELVLLSALGADAATRHRRAASVTLATPATAVAGGHVRVSGRLRPRHRGRVVVIQRHTHHGWVRVQRVRTDRSSRFHARLTVPRAGTVAYRAHVARTRRVRAASSPVRRVRVQAPADRRRAQSSPAQSSPAQSSSWPACGSSTPVKADGTPWQCTFDDEFDANTGDPSALDSSRWMPEVSSANAFYTGDPATGQVCYLDQPNTISVSGGALHLSVVKTKEPTPCGAYTTAYQGGMVHTFGKFAQTYGRFEVRAKLPDNRLPGVQETLWLYPVTPKYGPWPNSGEIDFAEFYSQYPTLDVPYVHYRYDPVTTNPLTSTNEVTSYTCAIDPSQWNTYTLDWEPGTMTISDNGRTCLVDHYQASNTTDPAAPFNQPFYVLLTQAVGLGTNAPNALTTFPATLDVDYVRVWK